IDSIRDVRQRFHACQIHLPQPIHISQHGRQPAAVLLDLGLVERQPRELRHLPHLFRRQTGLHARSLATPPVPAAQQSPVPHPDRPSRRVRPWIGPLISAALLAALLAIAATLPANPARGGYSQAGAWIRQHLLPPDRTFPAITTTLDLYFVREPTGLRLIDTD